jgi:formate hydrogenlyase subunit 6/NADH:ubiquinone oxidoreductase subunit I
MGCSDMHRSLFLYAVMLYRAGRADFRAFVALHATPSSLIRHLRLHQFHQIGHAVWVKKNCVVLTDGVACGNCARHCPVGAIQMIPSEPGNPDSLKIPAVNVERCIGCGACENLCPSRPFSAIYVEGHEMHRMV